MAGVTVSAGTLVFICGAIRPNANTDTIVASDSVNGTTGWTVVSHNRAGTTDISFIAWSLMPSGLSSGSVTISDGSGAVNFSFCGFGAYKVTGNASSSVNDSAATNGTDQAATTTPAITSGTPANAGDLFVAVYSSANTNAGAYTEDAAWNNLFNKLGNTSNTISAAYVVNASATAKTWQPTTGNVFAVQEITAFKVAGGTTFNQSVNATTTPNATIARQTGKPVAATSTPNATIVRLTNKAVNANSTPNAAIVRANAKIVKIDTTPNASIVRSTLKPVAASSTPNATIARSTGKVVAAATTPNATIVETQNHQFTQTLSISTTPNASVGALLVPAGTSTLPPHRGVLIVGKLTHRNP